MTIIRRRPAACLRDYLASVSGPMMLVGHSPPPAPAREKVARASRLGHRSSRGRPHPKGMT